MGWVRHGMRTRTGRTRTYACWVSMVQRIVNPNCCNYPRYGGRGLDIDPRWRADFINFLADMGEVPEGRSIERIDNARGYWPGNCRWATKQEQQANRATTAFLTIAGERLPLQEWSRRTGISPHVLAYRAKKKWPESEMLSALDKTRRVIPKQRKVAQCPSA